MNRFLIILFFFSTNYLCAQVNTEMFKKREDRVEKAWEYYDRATELMGERQFDKAIEYFDSATSLRPAWIEVFLSRAEANESRGDYVAALVDYEAAIRIDREDPNIYFKRGLVYHKIKNYGLAIGDFTYLIDVAEFGNTKAVFFKGEQVNEGGEATFSGIETLDKMKADVYNARGLSYATQGQNAKAIKDFDNAINRNASESGYYTNRGLSYLYLSDTLAAKNDFVRAVELSPEYEAALFNLVKITTGQERELMKKELFESNDASAVFSQKGYEKYLHGDYRGALVDYDSAIFWMPRNADDYMNRGLVKVKLKQSRSAIEDFEKSLSLDRTLLRNHVLIGNAYQSLKSYEEAVEYYKYYLLVDGVDASVLYNKGVAELKLGNKEIACRDFKKAVELGEERAIKPMQLTCE